MTTQTQTQSQNIPPPPADWLGSLPEWLCFETLRRLGLVPGVDFIYQSPLSGGRLAKGGLVIDFLFINPPNLAINVQGVYFHYELGVSVQARDIMARAQLAGDGVTLIFIDEDDLARDARFYVSEALGFRDHSRLGR
jgi:hypothetical protein